MTCGLLSVKRQAIIWTSANVLSIGHLGTNLLNLNWNSKFFILKNALIYWWLGTARRQRLSGCGSDQLVVCRKRFQASPRNGCSLFGVTVVLSIQGCVFSVSIDDPCRGSRTISQIPRFIRQISHNALFCNRNVHTCTFLLQNGALWDMGLVNCGIWATGLFWLRNYGSLM